MSGSNTTVRLTDSERAFLDDWAGRCGRSRSEVVRSLLPSGAWVAALERLAAMNGINPLEMPRWLMAEGLRRVAERGGAGAVPTDAETMTVDELAAFVGVESLTGGRPERTATQYLDGVTPGYKGD